MPTEIERLIEIMTRLRDPEGGCPWDVEQDFASIAPHTIEEAYEVADAIERQDMKDLRDELGDLLLQVVFHAQMAREDGLFQFDDVAAAICDKLVRRHPHVFGDLNIDDAETQTVAWEDLKANERKAEAGEERATSALAGVTVALPALTRALKLQKRAARVGFDWPDVKQVLDKLEEEIAAATEVIVLATCVRRWDTKLRRSSPSLPRIVAPILVWRRAAVRRPCTPRWLRVAWALGTR